MTRGQRGRLFAKLEFAAAIVGIGVAACLLVSLPGYFFDPMAGNGTSASLMAVFGIGGVAVGLVWMVRVYRADLEPDQRAWRYRDRD